MLFSKLVQRPEVWPIRKKAHWRISQLGEAYPTLIEEQYSPVLPFLPVFVKVQYAPAKLVNVYEPQELSGDEFVRNLPVDHNAFEYLGVAKLVLILWLRFLSLQEDESFFHKLLTQHQSFHLLSKLLVW